MVDKLTGLYTRTDLLDVIKLSKVSNDYVLLLGIRRMMYINDCCGHIEGDTLIKYYADLLKVRYKNVYRDGSNEFAIILSIEEAIHLINTLPKVPTELKTKIDAYNDNSLLGIGNLVVENLIPVNKYLYIPCISDS